MASLVALICVSIIVSSTARNVIITDGNVLKNYLCHPDNGIIPANTTFVLSKPVLTIQDDSQVQFCLMENTSNISFVPSQELLDGELEYVTVLCDLPHYGFGFFNVTNLTLNSISFENCNTPITAEAVRYINDTDQFFYFVSNFIPKFSLIFNHCYNLKLFNITALNSGSIQSYMVVDILGVNILGQSEIVGFLPEENRSDYPLVEMLIYFTDSTLLNNITYSKLKSNLSITTNTLSYYWPGDDFGDIFDQLRRSPHRMPIDDVFSVFGLYLTQQSFDVDVVLNIDTQNKSASQSTEPMSLIIMFVNSVTKSLVTFRGMKAPYQVCLDLDKQYAVPTYRSMVLIVIFHETQSLRKRATGDVTNPMVIKNTSFINLHNEHSDELEKNLVAMLQILKLAGELSHEVVMENVAWCQNDFVTPLRQPMYPFHAENQFTDKIQNGHLYLKFSNVKMHHNNLAGDQFVHKSSNCLMCLVNVKETTIEGDSYFGENPGGTVISVISGALTITGNLTIKDGYSIKGGGIYLDTVSTLYLKEPLEAQFFNNNASQGSAIYAPIRGCDGDNQKVSVIQIWPNKVYSLENISNISIKLHFRNNSEGEMLKSFHAPHFSFWGSQTSEYLLFNSTTLDLKHAQYAYTTLIDAILDVFDEVDRFTSLSNGLCILQPSYNFLQCGYIDHIYNISKTKGQCPETLEALFYVDSYPGATAFKILNVNKQYLYEVGHCKHDEISERSEYQMYNHWKTTADETSLSFILNFSESLTSKSTYFTILLTTTEFTLPIYLVTMASSCPLGFSLNASCDCIKPLSRHGYECNIDFENFTSRKGYWTSVRPTSAYQTILFDDNCPPHYCKDGLRDFELNTSLVHTACLGNRMGVLCGNCKEDYNNYSVQFGSDACQNDCTDLYLLTLPVYALAGLSLVFLLFWLRLTVAAGNINGVIFYANMLGLVMDKLTANIRGYFLVELVGILISLLNLNLGFPLCFYKGMTPAAKVGFQFIFPTYLWCIVVGLIVVSRYSTRVSNLISRSSVQVLATLFYLSFSKLLHTVITIVSSSSIDVIIYDGESSYNVSEELVWYYNGEDEYGHGSHGFLLLLAAIYTLLYLLPYTTLVTFSYHFLRFGVFNRFFKPFVDAYGGPFKDKWRFWFGLRLWVTVILFSVNGALEGTNTHTMFLLHIVAILTLILLQNFVHPFKKTSVSLIDGFFMLNYWVIIAVYVSINSIFIEVYVILTLAAILVLCLIILYQVCSSKIHKYCQKRHEYEAINDSRNGVDERDSDLDLYQAAEERHQISY